MKCFNYSDVNLVYFMFISMLAKGYARCIRNYPFVLLAVLGTKLPTIERNIVYTTRTMRRYIGTRRKHSYIQVAGRMAAFMLCISIVTCFR